MRRTLIKTCNARKVKPGLFFRLWGLCDVDGMASVLRDCKWQKGVIHKGHETNDVYYYPVPDARIDVREKGKAWRIMAF